MIGIQFIVCPRVAVRHVKVKPRCAVLTMLKRLDKIRFRGPRTREDFPDLAESPPASDNECSDEVQLKPRPSLRETEEILRDPAGSGSPTMAAAIQDFQRSESDRLNEVKGHLEIALLEKHFLRGTSFHSRWCVCVCVCVLGYNDPCHFPQFL
ncbi:GRAM domain containing protein 4 [Dissostichus eleginoides]|uniref:GRAM domain containing protein 4 n=1 Tax=Dissostichus eleginoides TaxID=100907 RepID=A0AAD9FMI6_DISEL|nr:GRAM domain containing protein 4 [Dissostichus eleginoides]